MGASATRRRLPATTRDGPALASFQRGLSLQAAGHAARAVDSFKTATRLAPSHGPALQHLAVALTGLGREEEALDAWRRLHRLRPNDVLAALGLGQALLAAHLPEDALTLLTAAAAAHPANPALLRLNARALQALGHRPAAIGALYLAHDLSPADPGIHGELGHALFEDGRADTALPHCEEAFRRAPTAAHATTVGAVLIDTGRNADALSVVEQGLQNNRRALPLHINRSIALEHLGQMAEAVAAARDALAIEPGSAVAQHTAAAALLIQGALTAEAWALFEGRLSLPGGMSWSDPERRWRGGDINGRTILLHAEQGLGDTLQFVRYAPLVAAHGARVILAVQRPLLRLLQSTPGADQVVDADEPLPPFDLYAPLLSVPGLLGTTLDTIPPSLPYKLPGPAARVGPLRVGLAWAGGSSFIADRKRSIPPDAFAALATLPGVTLHGLQLDATPPPFATNHLQGVQDFADTAERVAGLDLVITVDTAIAHLAATMGKPTWLLSRHRGCWRWLQNRADSPWYPTMRIFRQPRPNDWSSVISQVHRALAEAAGRRP